MIIETAKFGTINIEDHQMITLVQPLIGFPTLSKFVLIGNGTTVNWLQSLDDKDVVFPVVDPFEVRHDYDVEIPQWDAAALQLQGIDDIQLLTITVMSANHEEIRTNLRAPIVVNRRNGLAKQVVLPDNELPIRYHFVPELAGNKEVAHVGANT